MTQQTRDDPARIGAFLQQTPMGRVGEADELIGPVIFLASHMSTYVTGAVMPVDGGFLCR
jgi:NAD(P)-dependent dehydrogenase (short-subunit alcohol dehydrogenase family)